MNRVSTDYLYNSSYRKRLSFNSSLKSKRLKNVLDCNIIRKKITIFVISLSLGNHDSNIFIAFTRMLPQKSKIMQK